MAGGKLLPNRPLEWSVHLARRRPGQAAAVAGVIAAAAVAAGCGFRSVTLGLLAAVLLTAALGDYFFPVRYTLGPEGVEACGLWHRRRMSWARVRRVIRDELGVKLSPLPGPSRLEAYRGIYLRFEDNAEDVMAFIAHHVSAEAVGGDDQSPL